MTSSQPSPSPEGVRCRSCGIWDSLAADNYCSACGSPLLGLQLPQRTPLLIDGVLKSRTVAVSNVGPHRLEVAIEPGDGAGDLLRYEPAEFVLEPERLLGVDFFFNEGRALPPGVTETTVNFNFLLGADGLVRLPLEVMVKSGPEPVVLAPQVDFGRLEEGASVMREIPIENRGGIPAELVEVDARGSDQIGLGPEVELPLLIEPGEILKLPVVWDTSAAAKTDAADPASRSDAAGQASLRLEFKWPKTPLEVELRAEIYRRQLVVDPAAVEVDPALQLHRHLDRVSIVNAGTVPLEIERIVADQPWIDLVGVDNTPFRLEPGDNARFEVLPRTKKLPAGSHLGSVLIHTSETDEPTTVPIAVKVHEPEPKPTTDYLGIDFGTTNSVVAYSRTAGEEKVDLVKGAGSDDPLIPSVLAFLGSAESYVVGEVAEREWRVHPERSVRSIKRVMGVQDGHEYCGQEFTPEQLAALIIRQLVESAEKQIFANTGKYKRTRRAIITVPANFFNLQIRGILEACKLAGLDIGDETDDERRERGRKRRAARAQEGIIIDEPSAAALYYLGNLQLRDGVKEEVKGRIASEEGLNLLIYDHGGGTLDVSIAQITQLRGGRAGLKVLATRGDNGVGGDSIDLAVMDLLLKKCVEDDNMDIPIERDWIMQSYSELKRQRDIEEWSQERWRAILLARIIFKDQAEKAKIELSNAMAAAGKRNGVRVDVVIPGEALLGLQKGKLVRFDGEVSYKISAEELATECQPLLVRSERVIRRAFEVGKLDPGQIHYLLHTGRQSLWPEIRQRVRKQLPELPKDRDLLEAEHLKVCVAKGAALYGRLKRGAGLGVEMVDEGRRLPHSYGFGVVEFATEVFEEVVAMGEVYPGEWTKHHPEDQVPEHGRMDLRIYENTGSRREIMENPEIRRIGEVSNLDTLADGKPGCDLEFVLDANRQLEVRADGHLVTIQQASYEDKEGWYW